MRALAIFWLTAACAFGWKITAESDREADFSRYKTFAIRYGELNTGTDAVKTQLEAAIASGLAARGLQMVSGKSDLDVHYYVATADKWKFVNFPDFRGRGNHLEPESYAEGTLVIALMDPATRTLVWRVTAVEKKSDTRSLDDKLDDLVRKAMEKYPPKKK